MASKEMLSAQTESDVDEELEEFVVEKDGKKEVVVVEESPVVWPSTKPKVKGGKRGRGAGGASKQLTFESGPSK